MLDACIRCGKCVEACPTRQPAGIAEADPVTVITGIIRNGEAPEASRQWAAVRP
jgi:ferredoxin